MAAVERVVEEGHPADVFVTSEFRRHREWGSRDRRLLSRLVFGAFRWRGWLGRYADRGDRVLIGAHLLESTESHPVIETMIRAIGSDPAGLAPLGDQSLEDKAVGIAPLLEGHAPSWRDLMPCWVSSELAVPPNTDPSAHHRRCVESFQRRPPLWLRAVGVSGEDLAQRLVSVGYEAAPHASLKEAVAVPSDRPHLPTLEKAIGPCFEVQDLASQAVVVGSAPSAGERWWDMCGGAGGKALDLASFDTRVWVSDIRPSALAEARRRCRRIGEDRIETFVHEATTPLPAGTTFDGVLVDAPCSGLGTWSRRPDARWQTDPAGIPNRARMQEAILNNAARHVRPGGRLVYAVCTLTRQETMDVAERFSLTHPSFVPEPGPHPLDPAQIAWPIWIWPWQGPCGGMFIARWRSREDG